MFRTLEGLVSKGVKVDIGIPHELWDKPSAEITQVRFFSILYPRDILENKLIFGWKQP